MRDLIFLAGHSTPVPASILTTLCSHLLSSENKDRRADKWQPRTAFLSIQEIPQISIHFALCQHLEWKLPTCSLFRVTAAHYEDLQLNLFVSLWQIPLEPSDLECRSLFPVGKPTPVQGKEIARKHGKNKHSYVRCSFITICPATDCEGDRKKTAYALLFISGLLLKLMWIS